MKLWINWYLVVHRHCNICTILFGIREWAETFIDWNIYICCWWLFSAKRSKQWIPDGRNASTARETMLKNKPNFLTVYESILVSLWTFSRCAVYDTSFIWRKWKSVSTTRESMLKNKSHFLIVYVSILVRLWTFSRCAVYDTSFIRRKWRSTSTTRESMLKKKPLISP